MTTPTPGPWEFHLGRGANPRFHIQTEGGYQIASTTELVRHPQAYEENAAREANARLIAAAWELLEAVRTLLNTPIDVPEEFDKALRQGIAAIAKAEGKL